MTPRAWMVAGALFLAFNLNLRAIGSRDTHVTEYVALSLAAQGDATLDEYPGLVDAGLARGYVSRTAGGHAYSNYPIVPALIAAPAYWLTVRAGWIDPASPAPVRVEAVGKIVASALTACACAWLVAIVSGVATKAPRHEGSVDHKSLLRAFVPSWRDPATAVTLAVAFGTPLWSSASQALWTHAPAALALAASLLCLQRGGAFAAASAGVAYAAAAACRPLLIVFLAGACLDRLLARDRRVVWLATGAALALAAVALYNTAVFGTPMGGQLALESAAVHQQTHLVAGAWSADLLSGLAGILLSPSRGILIYSPIVVLAGMGAWRARRDTATLLRVTLPLVAFLLGWASYAVWWGGHSYGPRYASDIAVPLGVLLAHGWTVKGAWALARTGLLAWSVFVQAIGVFAYPGGDWNARPSDVDRAHARLWEWHDSQIVRTLKSGLYKRRE